MSTILSATALAAAALCTSTEKARPQLNGVHVDGNGTIRATNGHILLQVAPFPDHDKALAEYPAPPNGHGVHFSGEGFIMPRAAALAASKLAPKKGHEALRNRVVAILHEGSAESFATDLYAHKSESFPPVEGSYPRVEQVIPKSDPILSVWVSPENLRTVLDAMLKAGIGQSHAPSVRMDFRSQLGAIVLTGTTPDGQGVLALCMPQVAPKVQS